MAAELLAGLAPALQVLVASSCTNVAALRCASHDLKLASQPVLEGNLLLAARYGALGQRRAAALTGLTELLGDGCTEEALEVAVVLLADPEQQVREVAIAVLPRLVRGRKNSDCQVAHAEVVAAMLPSLDDSAWSVRVGALRALPELAPRGQCEVLQAIAECLEHPDWVVRTAAVAALCRSVEPGKGEVAVEAAAMKLEHKDRQVREAAGDALAELAVKNGHCVACAVEVACSHEDARVRRAALQVLDHVADATSGNHEMHASLVKMALAHLHDPAGCVQETALHALGRLGGPSEANRQAGLAVAMAPYLADDDPHVREAAIVAMRHSTNKLDANLLAELLCFESPVVNHRAQNLDSRNESHALPQGCVIA